MTRSTISTSRITRLLRAWSDGDDAALQKLMDVVYEELRRIARAHVRREGAAASMRPTELVSELYMKLQAQRHVDLKDRAHFYAVASGVMRRLLVDHARHKRAGKRRGVHVTLSEGHAVGSGPNVDVLVLDDAMKKLEIEYPRECRVVELRYFAGLTVEEIAETLGVGSATVKRDWRFARTWLLGEMERGQLRGQLTV